MTDMRLPLPIQRKRREPPRTDRAMETDIVLAHLEDAVRQFDTVLDGLISVLRGGRR